MTELRRFGLVGPGAPWAGGIPRFTASLATQLAAHVDVDWLSWRPPTRAPLPPTTHLDRRQAPARAADEALDVYGPASWWRAGRRLRTAGAAVLTVTHPALALPYSVLARSYRRGGGRLVLLCHNVDTHEEQRRWRPLARRLLGLADAAIVHSAAEAALARRLAPRLEIVEAFHPVYPEHASRPATEPPRAGRLLFFGYVRPYKGLDDLLGAVALLPGVSLDVVGRFEEPSERYRRRARNLGVADRVRFHEGYVPEEAVPRLFADADVLVAPYRQSSQSGVVHLAYSLGRPVVASLVGGLAEAVRDGETGALAPPRDPHALAAAISRALGAPPGAYDDGLRRVLEERSWERYAALVLDAARGTASSPPGIGTVTHGRRARA